MTQKAKDILGVVIGVMLMAFIITVGLRMYPNNLPYSEMVSPYRVLSNTDCYLTVKDNSGEIFEGVENNGCHLKAGSIVSF